jgi:UTP--glucose-1-phosphate uridylyltransferase
MRLVESLIEKPVAEESPINYRNNRKDGEIQLTDGLSKFRKREVIYAKDIEGIRCNTDNKIGYIEEL